LSALLLDANVWLAAIDPTDRNHTAAQRLLEGDELLAALDLTLYEVANAAACAWRRPDEARKLVALVHTACPGTLAGIDQELAGQAIAVAHEHGLSVYDATYVAAARSRGWTLVSGDHRDLVKPGHALAPADAVAD
jgi:predicted nucleic acid-binding protein